MSLSAFQKTESTCRGTPVFMAPEIQLEDLKLAGQQDLIFGL